MNNDRQDDSAKAGVKSCTLCGRCLEVCPLFRVTDKEEFSPRAKHFLADRFKSHPDELSEMSVARLAGLCLSCGRCEKVCPQGLSGPDLAAVMRRDHPEWEERLWSVWIKSGRVLWPALAALARLAPDRVSCSGRGRVLNKLKSLSGKTGPGQWLKAESWGKTGAGRKLMLFPGCLASRVRTDWLKKAGRVVRALGFDRLKEGDWTCCGLTLKHAGLERDAFRSFEHNLAVWRKAGRPLIGVFCASCQRGLIGYSALDLGWEQGEAEAWLAAVTPLSSLFGRSEFRVADNAPERVCYHPPCHASDPDPDLAWLAKVLGERLEKPVQGGCCGLGGVMQLGAPEMSDLVGRECVRAMDPAPGGLILTGCSGCVTQLSSLVPKGVGAVHWLDVLDPGI